MFWIRYFFGDSHPQMVNVLDWTITGFILLGLAVAIYAALKSRAYAEAAKCFGWAGLLVVLTVLVGVV